MRLIHNRVKTFLEEIRFAKSRLWLYSILINKNYQEKTIPQTTSSDDLQLVADLIRAFCIREPKGVEGLSFTGKSKNLHFARNPALMRIPDSNHRLCIL